MVPSQAGFALASDRDLHRRLFGSREDRSDFCFGSVDKDAFL